MAQGVGGNVKVLAHNKKAFYNYEIMESYEAGIALSGAEVKSVRAGKISLVQGWVDMSSGRAMLREVVISPYAYQSWKEGSDSRPRALLLRKAQMAALKKKVEERGFSVVPTKVYLKNGWVKITISLAKGKKLHDKRASEKEKDARKKIHQSLKRRQHEEDK